MRRKKMAMSIPAVVMVQHVGEPCRSFLPQRYIVHLCRRAPILKSKGTHVCFHSQHLPGAAAAAVGTPLQHKDELNLVHSLAKASLVAALTFSMAFNGFDVAEARPEGVNRPELLPKSFTPVIDAAGFLSEGQEGRIVKQVTNLEEETGFKLRVLAQNYPNTPGFALGNKTGFKRNTYLFSFNKEGFCWMCLVLGLAIKDFWKVDDSTIVFVADPSLGGNILNFNVGAAVDLSVPRSFWTRLAGKYGNMFYWQEKGEDASIEAAVSAISTCLREPPGPRACSNIE